jgi:hypothetical protein
MPQLLQTDNDFNLIKGQSDLVNASLQNWFCRLAFFYLNRYILRSQQPKSCQEHFMSFYSYNLLNSKATGSL